MEKYLVTIEFRYNDSPNGEVITIGVFDTRDEANLNGNKALEVFETKFKLNPNYNKKRRFSNNGGCFGYPESLISDSAYLQTPFAFYAKVTKLKYDDVEQTINNVLEKIKKYNEFRDSECDDE